MTDLAPLFGLRLRTPRLELRLGTSDDVRALGRLAQLGIHPPDEMPFAVAWSDGIAEPGFEEEFAAYHAEGLAVVEARGLAARPPHLGGTESRRHADSEG